MKEDRRRQLTLTDGEHAAIAAAVNQERRVRIWRRYQAILVLAQGQVPTAIAATLGCSLARVYTWAAAWRQQGGLGLQEGAHQGRSCLLAGSAQQHLETRLVGEPQQHGDQVTGWTVPRLQTELGAAGYGVRQRTIRRTWHRLGWRWTRPT
jgi:transposase